MGINKTSDVNYQDDVSQTSPPGEILEGPGGPTIVWEGVIIGTDAVNYNDNKNQGTSAVGTFLDASGDLLSGTARIETDTAVVSSRDVAGRVKISTGPPPGVLSGVTAVSVEYNFRFIPSISGVEYFEEDIPTEYDAGTIQYGEVSGTITDYSGEPIEGQNVIGSGLVSRTDESGNYSLSAPGGGTITLQAIGTTDSFSPAGGQTVTADFQSARLEIEVLTPELNPVSGANVRVGDSDYQTDENGKVIIDPAFITEYQVLVSNRILRSANIQQQGDLYNLTIGGEGNDIGATIRVIDGKTGERVREVPCEMPESGVRASSGVEGVARVFSESPQEGAVVIGEGDQRYVTQTIPIDLDAGDELDDRIVLERAKGGSTY